MPVYKLYNLDIGENPIKREFKVGPYEIKLVDDYDKKQKQLSSLAIEMQESEIINGRLTSSIYEIPPKVGEALITAEVHCNQEPNAKLSSSSAELTGIWDLCLIFSYLLGRWVYIEEGKRRFNHINHGLEIVQKFEVVKASYIAWENIENFVREEEIRPLWYYLHMNGTPEVELRLLLGCVALEIIQNNETNNSTIDVSSELEELINIIIMKIKSSQIEEELKDRLKGTVNQWGKYSSLEKFRKFLINYKIVDNSISESSQNRIKSINRFRNGVVHSGIIKKPKWIKDEKTKMKVAAFYAAQFIPGLIQEYLNRKFGLKDNFDWPKQNFEFLKEYIEKGIWDDENIELPS